MADRLKGRVKALKDTYGFVKTPDGREFFFHAGAMDKDTDAKFDQLKEGAAVEFDEAPSPRGPRASNIRMV